MFTANTMSSAIEALGMAPPGTASRPVVKEGTRGKLTEEKREDCKVIHKPTNQPTD